MRNITKLYDKLVLVKLKVSGRQDVAAASEEPQAHTDLSPDKFEEKVQLASKVQDEINAVYNELRRTKSIKVRQPYDDKISGSVLEGHLRIWQPTKKEFRNLLKHMRDIKQSKEKLLKQHMHRIDVERSGTQAKSDSNLQSNQNVMMTVSGCPVDALGPLNSSQSANPVADDGALLEGVLGQAPELVHIANLAILDGLVKPALSGHFRLSPKQRAYLACAMNFIAGNSQALICLDNLVSASNTIRSFPFSEAYPALLVYGFKDTNASAILAALVRVTQKRYHQFKMGRLGQQILVINELIAEIGNEIEKRLPLLHAMRVFEQFFNSMPNYIPNIWCEIALIMRSMIGSQHHYDNCHDCNFILHDPRANAFLKGLFLRKHLVGFFKQARYAFHDFPCALMPLLSKSTEAMQPCLEIIRLRTVVTTPNGNCFAILNHGQQSNFDRQDDTPFHAIQVIQLPWNDFTASCTKVDAFTALQDLVRLSAICPENVVFAYYGSLRATVEFFNIGFAAGLISDQTTFYQLDLRSCSISGENIFGLQGQAMPFKLKNLFRLRLRHDCMPEFSNQDPTLSSSSDSFIEKTIHLLGKGPDSRFQLSVELHPLEIRKNLRHIITPQVVLHSFQHLRLRGCGEIPPECFQLIGDAARDLFSLNLSHTDLAPVEDYLQQILQTWHNVKGGPKKEINLDESNLSKDSTVKMLFALGARPDSTVQTLSLNGNPRVRNTIFEQLRRLFADSSLAIPNMHMHTSLRYLFANACCLGQDGIHYLRQMESQNVNLTIQAKPEGHFRHTGVLIHDGTNLTLTETVITV